MLEIFKKDILPLKDKLFRIAWRITGDRDEAEDVVQNLMLKLWDMREKWSSIENIDAYCCTISRNMAFETLKKRTLLDSRESKLHGNIPELQSGVTDDNYGGIESRERSRIIRKVIGKLPEKERSVMELRDIEGMSYKEISQVLDYTEAQVKIHLFRARNKIKEYFSGINREDI